MPPAAPSHPAPTLPAFLTGGGDAAALIAQRDWSQTPLGAIGAWPVSLKSAVGLVVRSPTASVLLLGTDGVLLYNDAYAVIAGDSHPQALGCKLGDVWPEHAAFNQHVMATVWAGKTLAYDGRPFTIQRNGLPKTVLLTLHYSAVIDDDARTMGVLAQVLETTSKVYEENWLTYEREHLRRAFEQSPSFMAILRGPDHIFELVNVAYMQLVGHQDVLGLAARDAFGDTKKAGYFAMLDQVFNTGQAHSEMGVPVTLQLSAGADLQQHFVDLFYQPVRDPSGAVIGIFVRGTDVTERQLAVNAVEANAAQFRTFAQAQPNQVWTSPANGLLDWFNDRVYEYSGAAPGALNGLDWAQIVHPDDIEAAAAQWMQCLQHGSNYDTEFRIRRHDGAYRWHLARALPLREADGTISRWIGTNTDIHAHKLHAAERDRDLSRIWTLSRELMLICDTQGTIAAVNPASVEMLGWTEEDMVGRQVDHFLHAEDIQRTRAEREKVTGGTATHSFENRYRTKSGDYKVLNWTAVPDGERVHAIARDVTRERIAEDSLRQFHKMEALGQLTGGIAHDFNNLLQGIMGNVGVVKRLVTTNRAAETEKYLERTSEAIRRAAALTHRLLAYARRQPLEPRAVQVNPLIESMEDLFHRTLGESIQVHLALDSHVWPTQCDPNQLENALLNLVINSRDAMPGGGKLTIETRNAALEGLLPLDKDGIQPGRYVCIAVSDTGSGMSLDTQSKAFEPFFTTKPTGQGTGLGLSMIYGFARQSDGYAKIYSELGIGTTVKLYLPQFVADGTAVEEPAPESAPVAKVRSVGVIAVVEDDPDVRDLIVESLQDAGFVVLHANDGTSGLRLLQSPVHIDMLLTDVGLPGLNGRQLADACRAQRPDMKILFMTGYAENAMFTAGYLDSGMAMITKPFALDVLVAKVQLAFENASASAGANADALAPADASERK